MPLEHMRAQVRTRRFGVGSESADSDVVRAADLASFGQPSYPKVGVTHLGRRSPKSPPLPEGRGTMGGRNRSRRTSQHYILQYTRNSVPARVMLVIVEYTKDGRVRPVRVGNG
jgi:hypothetical protein